MVKRWLSRACLRGSGILAAIAFKFSDDSPIETAATPRPKQEPTGEITQGVLLSTEARRMRVDLTAPPKRPPTKQTKPLEGSAAERVADPWAGAKSRWE